MMNQNHSALQCGKRFLLFGKIAFSFFSGAFAQMSRPLLRSSAVVPRMAKSGFVMLSTNKEKKL